MSPRRDPLLGHQPRGHRGMGGHRRGTAGLLGAGGAQAKNEKGNKVRRGGARLFSTTRIGFFGRKFSHETPRKTKAKNSLCGCAAGSDAWR